MAMTMTMKFNKKVYVIPQEKYHSLLENHKKYTTDEPGRLAAAAAAGQVPSFRVPGEVQAGPSSSAGARAAGLVVGGWFRKKFQVWLVGEKSGKKSPVSKLF